MRIGSTSRFEAEAVANSPEKLCLEAIGRLDSDFALGQEDQVSEV
jgi:hypothetical protein